MPASTEQMLQPGPHAHHLMIAFFARMQHRKDYFHRIPGSLGLTIAQPLGQGAAACLHQLGCQGQTIQPQIG